MLSACTRSFTSEQKPSEVASTTKTSIADKFVKNPYEVNIARDFVYYAHSDLQQMEAYADKYPHIIHAVIDWGDGDFESAMGATGHMGNRDNAEFLIGRGARPDIFVMTMLGMTDAVIGILTAYPSLLNVIGPHGFTLLHHAEVGGDAGKSLYEYLLNAGLTEKFVETFVKE